MGVTELPTGPAAALRARQPSVVEQQVGARIPYVWQGGKLSLYGWPVNVIRCVSSFGRQGRTIASQVGEEDQRTHEDLAQQATRQIPEITGPDTFEGDPLDELTEERVESIAPARELATEGWPGGILLTTAKRREQCHVALRQLCAQARYPRILVSDEETARARTQISAAYNYCPVPGVNSI